MALVSLRQLLDHAAENDYGVPTFNVNNLPRRIVNMLEIKAEFCMKIGPATCRDGEDQRNEESAAEHAKTNKKLTFAAAIVGWLSVVWPRIKQFFHFNL